jgi:hypothetical protein
MYPIKNNGVSMKKRDQRIHYIERLKEIENLKPEWFGPNDGVEFSQSDTNITLSLISYLVEINDIPAPYIYPLPDHEITLEWDMGPWNVNCDIVFDNNIVKVHSMNMKTEIVETLEVTPIKENINVLGIFLLKFMNPKYV